VNAAKVRPLSIARLIRVELVVGISPNNFSLWANSAASSEVQREIQAKYRSCGRASDRPFLSFLFPFSKLHADRYGAATEVASDGRWPWESKPRCGTFFAAFLHNSSSLLAGFVLFLFHPRLANHAYSFEFQASPRAVRRRGAARTLRALFVSYARATFKIRYVLPYIRSKRVRIERVCTRTHAQEREKERERERERRIPCASDS